MYEAQFEKISTGVILNKLISRDKASSNKRKLA